MKIILLAILLLSTSVTAKQFSNVTVDKVISVYDGDTFRGNLKGYPSIIGDNIYIRVNRTDAPEIRGKCDYEKQLALKARGFTKAFLSDGEIELRNIRGGKFFRIAADVYVNNVSLGDSLIKANLAYKYNKKTKRNWGE